MLFRHLLHYIATIIRVLNIPERHVLIYGGKNAGKCTLVRIASFVYCGADADVIANMEGWKKQLAQSLSALRSTTHAHPIAFRLREHEQ